MTESEIRKRHIEEAEDDDEAQEETIKFKSPLPIRKSVESIASRHDGKSAQSMIPIQAPSTKVQEQIKARFSIGGNQSVEQQQHSNNNNNTTTIPSPIMKKKRKLVVHPSRSTKSHTIVLTSMFTPIRKQCEEAIKKLGTYQLAAQ